MNVGSIAKDSLTWQDPVAVFAKQHQ